MSKEFKISLAAARVNAGLTQQKVADMMHISNRTLINWEKGNISPSYSDLQMLCDIYKVSIDFILLPIKST